MDLLDSLDQEVSDIVDQLAPELIILLLEKWEQEIEYQKACNTITTNALLNHYVRIKICAQKLKRGWNDCHPQYTDISHEQFIIKTQYLNDLVKKARRDYYVAKRRNEDEHASECSCRGCRCLKEFNGLLEVSREGCIGGAGDEQASGLAGQGPGQVA